MDLLSVAGAAACIHPAPDTRRCRQPQALIDARGAQHEKAPEPLQEAQPKEPPEPLPRRALEGLPMYLQLRPVSPTQRYVLSPRCRYGGDIELHPESMRYVTNLPSRWNWNRGMVAKGHLMELPLARPPPLGAAPKLRRERRRPCADLQLQTELRSQDTEEVATLLRTNFHPGVADLIDACVAAGQRVHRWSETDPEDVRVWQLRAPDGELCSAVAWRPLLLPERRGLEVLFLATAPSRRGSGCAEDLVGRLEDFARLSGWDFLCVAVVPAAPGFWGKCGLELCAGSGAVRGDRDPSAREGAWLRLPDGPARLVGACCGAAPLRDALLRAMVSFSDTPLFVKCGLRGPEIPPDFRDRRRFPFLS